MCRSSQFTVHSSRGPLGQTHNRRSRGNHSRQAQSGVSEFSRQRQLNSTQLNSTQLNSTQLNSTQLNSAAAAAAPPPAATAPPPRRPRPSAAARATRSTTSRASCPTLPPPRPRRRRSGRNGEPRTDAHRPPSLAHAAPMRTKLRCRGEFCPVKSYTAPQGDRGREYYLLAVQAFSAPL